MAQVLLKSGLEFKTQLQPVRSQKVLSVRGVGKAWSPQHRVLDDINFDLHTGELVVVIGRSERGNRRCYIC